MKKRPIAAVSALLALAFSACATSGPSPVVQESQKVETGIDGISEPTSVGAPVEVKTGETKETLLYGAMTKYELMTFVKAIQNANLQTALESNDPMTIFAPDNFAFEYANLPDQTDLGTLLKGHVVSGVLTWENLYDAVIASNAPLTLDTLAGTQLTVYLMDDKLKIAGSDGQLATISQADIIQTNGIMHQINTVLQP